MPNWNPQRNPQSLQNVRPPLPEGVRSTRALRFTLPEALADRLEEMSKLERDELVRRALEAL